MPNESNIHGKGFDKKPEHINRKGRPKKIPALELLLADIFSDKEMTLVLKSLYKMATKGNIRAIELLLDRCYGRPMPALTIERLTEEQLKQLHEYFLKRYVNGESGNNTEH